MNENEGEEVSENNEGNMVEKEVIKCVAEEDFKIDFNNNLRKKEEKNNRIRSEYNLRAKRNKN